LSKSREVWPPEAKKSQAFYYKEEFPQGWGTLLIVREWIEAKRIYLGRFRRAQPDCGGEFR